MSTNDRIQKFIELQDKDISFEDIAKELEISKNTLRNFLNKRGYKSKKGKYILVNKQSQIQFDEVKKSPGKKINKKGESNEQKNITKKVVSKASIKKEKKVNVTQEDIDKLCEVYDWYLQVKDCKSIKPKKRQNKKDVNIEEKNITNLKSTNIKVDKNTWEEFERLCSNSEFNKKEILTQALKDFMKEYKHLL